VSDRSDPRLSYFDSGEDDGQEKELQRPASPRVKASRANAERTGRQTETGQQPAIVSAPRTKKGVPKVFASSRAREARAKLLFAGLLIFALVGLVSTCQNLIGDDQSSDDAAAAVHSHDDIAVWHALARAEGAAYVAGDWAEMLPFPHRNSFSGLSSTDSGRLAAHTSTAFRPVAVYNSRWSRTGSTETHEVLVETETSDGGARSFRVEMTLTAGPGETVRHETDPQMSPTADTPTYPRCDTTRVRLSGTAEQTLERWAEAWLANDAAELVRTAGETSVNVTFPGVGDASGGVFGLAAVLNAHKPCRITGEDYLTVSLLAVDCETGNTAVFGQNIELAFRDTANPLVPRWSPVGETPADRSRTTADAPTGNTRSECAPPTESTISTAPGTSAPQLP